MSQQGLLTDLCTVCYTEKPKYKCPRCKVQTCSLPCYKKHQQRASCSGKRDPAAYLRKSQLATPAGLDQDFNYLKGIEHHIDQANETFLKPAKEGTHESFRTVATGWRPDSRLQRYLTKNYITLEHAPRGLQRQRENTTRSTKSNRVLWTVEWRMDSGEREVHHDCRESSSLAKLFAESRIGRRISVNSRADEVENRQSKRRKRLDTAVTSLETANASTVTELKLDQPAPGIDVQPKLIEAEDDGVEAVITETSAHSAPAANDLPNLHSEETSLKRDGLVVVESETTEGADQQKHTALARNFYLLRPATTGTSKVLIPLHDKATLTECLKNRTIQEYPTLIVLSKSPQALPTGFILQDDYMRRIEEEDAELTRHTQSTDGQRAVFDGDSGGQQMAGESAPLDAQSILDMLKRDVRA
ncbi:Box C/D snoRNA accumulation [Friedmanniomyces endolithicus]|uniref:Box C/D snoRNA protein 1 n=1 Tax=Friedmanniomyces endolithicus TaxID=329885 RepID=A0AAN6QWY5_9PEZI|nr:Box C/D snoRNA accumulation [Friedmanniomyces endolithicus]KAK0283193.1 Box C/D snoRNA accumulation [Friedmanniomyces endolithicus]KAK0320051.1 Box C/D snoRNA accumulation [Friedmanniomyces endolithicus]KAK0923813.1 Box C/D snoRNA accumulation [Friedmanniomyces endolithicus]KAK0995631.1 Box C/D snoRNA accumulation [Friedmanniomyces endolithicus]